ncbi:MAG: hypothetical protein HC819_15905 [Cyclobacteriaceae bacterium]|nr:hypothetical protein [Cyclobacteriaceae bacterium]
MYKNMPVAMRSQDNIISQFITPFPHFTFIGSQMGISATQISFLSLAQAELFSGFAIGRRRDMLVEQFPQGEVLNPSF